jgi:predicted  nucleic acid-binding Zn-ribbon protein
MDKIYELVSKIESDFTKFEDSLETEVLKRSKVLTGHLSLLKQAKQMAADLLVLLRGEISHLQGEKVKAEAELKSVQEKTAKTIKESEEKLASARKEIEAKEEIGVNLDAQNKKSRREADALEMEKNEQSTYLVGLQREVNKATRALQTANEELKKSEGEKKKIDEEVGTQNSRLAEINKEIRVKEERVAILNKK